MYNVSYFNGAGLHGLTMGTKAAGGAFNCTATYCYAIGATNLTLFKRLQTGLYMASRLKNLPVPTTSVTDFADGNIGPATVSLAKKLAAILGPAQVKFIPTLAKLDSVGNITFKTLSENADALAPELEQFVSSVSPAGAGAMSLSPQPTLPTPGVTLPGVPQPNVAINATLPTVPNTGFYSLTSGGQAPSAGPRIEVTSPGVTLPGPNPNVGSDPSGAGYPSAPAAKPGMSNLALVGLGVGVIGLIGGIVWALRRHDHHDAV